MIDRGGVAGSAALSVFAGLIYDWLVAKFNFFLVLLFCSVPQPLSGKLVN